MTGNFLWIIRMTEQRRSHRIEPSGLVAKTGQIFLTPSSGPIECRVVDLSSGGACLESSILLDFPQRFEFRHGGVRRYCTLAWKRRYRFGIQFSGSPNRSAGALSRPSTSSFSRFR
jgi:PilZ domain